MKTSVLKVTSKMITGCAQRLSASVMKTSGQSQIPSCAGSSAQRLSASVMKTFRDLPDDARLLMCSTPFGICDEDIHAHGTTELQRRVLNAFRHL